LHRKRYIFVMETTQDTKIEVIEQLKLCNQMCFPLYTASRLIIRMYTPFLSELGLTYPQYLVMLVLWEHQKLMVNDINRILILDNNTVSPLLQRMEKMGLLTRTQDKKDHRKVIVKITKKGMELREAAKDIPAKMGAAIPQEPLQEFDYPSFYRNLSMLVNALSLKTK